MRPSPARLFLVLLLLLALAAAAAVWSHGRAWRLPDRHNPWAPLDVTEAPNWLTGFKLRRLGSDGVLCGAALASAGFTAEPLPDRETGPGCGFDNALTVRRLHTLRLSAPFALSCRSAVSLALWERHAVLPAAERWLASPPRTLQHFGSYACRNVYGRDDASGARRSQHASADALDVAGFTLADGRRITVSGHWRGDDAASRAFLHDVQQGACRFFDGALGPDYNAAHADHLHLDRGPFRVCR